jgi:hypothetical protein
MRSQVINVVKVCWFLACLAVLAWGIFGCEQEANPTLRGECAFLAGSVLALFSLPLSIVWWVLLNAAAYGFSLFGIEVGESPAFGAAAWLGFVVVGYLQWFMLMPWLRRKCKARSTTGNAAPP